MKFFLFLQTILLCEKICTNLSLYEKHFRRYRNLVFIHSYVKNNIRTITKSRIAPIFPPDSEPIMRGHVRRLSRTVWLKKWQLEVCWIRFVWILPGPRLLISFPFMGGERLSPRCVGEWEKATVCLVYKRGWKASEVKWCVHTKTPQQRLMIICRAWKKRRESEE